MYLWRFLGIIARKAGLDWSDSSGLCYIEAQRSAFVSHWLQAALWEGMTLGEAILCSYGPFPKRNTAVSQL